MQTRRMQTRARLSLRLIRTGVRTVMINERGRARPTSPARRVAEWQVRTANLTTLPTPW